MFTTGHRGGCCGINELKAISPGNLVKGGPYESWPHSYGWRKNTQYRAHCTHNKRAWMEPELIAAGFMLLATNNIDTVWGRVG